jgi:hypothetical protein
MMIIQQLVDERVASKTQGLRQSVNDLWSARISDVNLFDRNVAGAVQRNVEAKRKANLKQNRAKMPNVKSGEQV